MNLDFSEIKSWDRFENLMESYLNKLKEDKTNNIFDVKSISSGKGADGGKDILVTFSVNDGLSKFERKWVIQCKFYKTSVTKEKLSSVNIPSLIHQYNADGYLLVCKNDVTVPVRDMFNDLERNCKFKYRYIIWKGEDFLERLYNTTSIHQHYFPKYWKSVQNITKIKK